MTSIRGTRHEKGNGALAVGLVAGVGQVQDQDQEVGKMDVIGSVDQPVSSLPSPPNQPGSHVIVGA